MGRISITTHHLVLPKTFKVTGVFSVDRKFSCLQHLVLGRECVAWIRNRGGDEEGKDREKSEMCLSPALSLSFLSPVPQETLVLRLRDVSFLNGSIFCVVRVVLRRGVCPYCALACVLLGPGRKAGDRERVR